MGLASFPVAELTKIGIPNVDTAAKAIAENADIAIGAKVRMLENVIAKNAFLQGRSPLQEGSMAIREAGLRVPSRFGYRGITGSNM
jgi:dihydroorotase